jgi:hypothetical protein
MKWRGAVLAVLRRPDLWSTAVRQILTLVPRNWRSSHRPLPDKSYVQFRSLTQYGSPDQVPTGADVVSYLSWCRSWHRTVASR